MFQEREAAALDVTEKRTESVNEEMWKWVPSNGSQGNVVHDGDAVTTLVIENGWTKQVDDMAKVGMSTTKKDE